MQDQAQGLRALVNQARRDQHSPSIVLDARSADAPSSTSASAYSSFTTNGTAVPVAHPAVQQTYTLDRGEVQAVVSAPRSNETRAETHTLPPPKAARIIAVTSGKGGVGKTNFSTNLSVALSSTTLQVIVVDADLGLANLHVVCGVAPKYHLEHVMRGERSLRDILCPGPNGVQLIAGASGLAELANLDELRRTAFVENLYELDQLADVIVIDTGAGLSRNVMAFLCAVDEVIVVTTPEPTAITDAYATIKVLSQENPAVQLQLVVNMAQSSAEAGAVASRLKSIVQRFLQRDLHYLGFVPQDPAVSKAVRIQQPFVLAYPSCQAAQAIRKIAASFCNDVPIVAQQPGVGKLVERLQRYFGFGKPTRSNSDGFARKPY
jgi:flagellar biosynthesis protein FlhG